MLPFVFREKSENAKYVTNIRSCSGIAVFCSAKNEKAHWIAAGRDYQRFALEATVLGLKNAFINQPVEVPAVRSHLATFLGLDDRRPDLVGRFGHEPLCPGGCSVPSKASSPQGPRIDVPDFWRQALDAGRAASAKRASAGSDLDPVFFMISAR